MEYKNSIMFLGLMKVYSLILDSFDNKYRELFPTLNFRLRTAFFNKYIDFETLMRNSIENINKTKELDNYYNKEILENIIFLLDSYHKRVIDELQKMTLSSLSNADNQTIPCDSFKTIKAITDDVLNSPEIRYFFRMSTFHIIFEGPDRSGKSTLIKCFQKFLRQPFKSIIHLNRKTNTLVHVNEEYKMKAKNFLDLSKQEDRLLFQNKLFFDVSTNIFNKMRDFKYGMNLLMDRSLVSNLIYSNVMLDDEHFIKYLFTNFDLAETRIANEEVVNNEKNHFVFDIKTIEKSENHHITIPLDFNIEDILDIESRTMINPIIQSTTENNFSRKNRRFFYRVFNSALDSYITKILYVKNTTYSYNKLDEIEKNVNQKRIIDLYSKFKGLTSLDDLYQKYLNTNVSADKHDSSLEFSFKLGDNTVDCDFAKCLMQTIITSFDENAHLGLNIDIMYDDDNVSNVETVFNNALNRIIENNYRKYINEKGPKCCNNEESTEQVDGY